MMNVQGLIIAFLMAIVLVVSGASNLHATVHEIQVGNFFFSPQGTMVNPGDRVRWILAEGVHTTTSAGDSPRAWASGTMNSPGQTFEVQFTAGYDQAGCCFKILWCKQKSRYKMRRLLISFMCLADAHIGRGYVKFN